MSFALLEIVGFVLVLLVLGLFFYRVILWFVRLRDESFIKEISLKKFNLQVEADAHLADKNKKETPGWNGFRNFIVDKKIEESHDCVSIILKPQDGKPIPKPLPGQYLTVRARLPGVEKPIVRCYSISEEDTSIHYRITVKKLPAPNDDIHIPSGVFSSFLSDYIRVGEVIEVKAPNGDFVLPVSSKESERPLLFIAGGIGITPILPMLQQLAREELEREVHLFWGVSSFSDLALSEQIGPLSEKENINLHVLISYAHERTFNETTVDAKSSKLEDERFPSLVREDSGEKLYLYEDEVIVGRAQHSQLVIEDDSLSASHANIYKRNNEWFIRDLGSSNGTFLNTKSISGIKAAWRSFKLNHNDEISFSNIKTKLLLPEIGNGADVSRQEVSKISSKGFMLHKGRVALSHINEFAEIKDAIAYICGPPGMIDTLSSELSEFGISSSDIRIESFGQESVKALPGSKGIEKKEYKITFSKSGKTVQWCNEDGSLLALAEKHGINLAYGCRAGHCGSCSVRLSEGTVRYLNNPTVPIEDESCLACTAIPEGNLVLDI